MSSIPLIELRGVTKTYTNELSSTPVLRGISLKINRGEFVAIMGPSGSGKSTLMNIMGFLDRVTTGEYLFQGERVGVKTDDELAAMRRDRVGFVFQTFNLLARTTVLQNVMLPLVYQRIEENGRRAQASRILHSVGLSHRLTHTPGQLSGGERQRVAIARALVGNPDVIFADEPTGNLDSKSGTEILHQLRQLHQEGRTIVMITHEKEAADYAERTVMIRDGVIVV